MSEPLLALKEITVSCEGEIRARLERFSLTIERGETVLMLGEADAGKDALMRALAGALDPGETISGRVQYGMGAELEFGRFDDLPIRRAYVPGPQAHPLSPYATAASQLSRVVARKTNVPRASALSEIEGALRRMDGAPSPVTFDKSPSEIPAEALAWGLFAAGAAISPELLLLDRLLVGLPPTSARAIVRAVAAEQERQGFAILYNALGTEVVRRFGGRLVVMRHGRIVEEGPVARLTTSQAHAYTQALLKASAPREGTQTAARAGARGQPVVQTFALEYEPKEKLTFELRRGGSLALIGEEGSGRRALARCLIGMEPIRSGRVVFDAVDVGILSKAMRSRMRRRVAVIAGADDVLDPRLTVFDTVSEPLRASLDLPRSVVAEYRDAALKRVGLPAAAGNMSVSRLSAFDKRRLQVARAIVSAPMFALIDEPFRGLDAFAQSVMRDLLKSFREEQGPAFLVITSDIAVAQALAEEAMIFHDGRIIERGPVSDILRAPKESYTRSIIDAATPVL